MTAQSDADPVSIDAVSNLASAIAFVLMVDSPSSAKTFLDMFDNLNEQTLPSGSAREKLRQMIEAQRGVLAHMRQP